MRSTSALVAAALFLLTGCSPSTSHDVKTGRLHRAYADKTRTDWANAGPRPLVTTVWYQASPDSIESEWSVGVFRFGHNALNAPFSDTGKRPLIIVSHGTGGSAAQLSWLAEGLVAAGFVVAAVNHHGNTATEDTRWPHGFVLPAERARDVSALIDHLLADDDLSSHIDPARIGAAGFSIGGYTVLASSGTHLTMRDRTFRCQSQPGNPVCRLPPEAGFSEADVEALANSDDAFKAALVRDAQPVNDPRIRAVYAIAPAFVSIMNRDDFSSFRVPARIVLAEDDQQILFSETVKSVGTNIPHASIHTIAGAGHYAFLAPCSFRGRVFVAALCKDSGTIDRFELHDRIGRDAAGFFGSHL